MQIDRPTTTSDQAAMAAELREPRVAVVLVHHRDAAATIACVASVQEHVPGTPIVLVDDASPDGSGEQLRERFAATTDVQLVLAPQSRGFGAGCNLGIERALARFADLEHVLLLQATARLRPGALTAMRACAMHHGRAGIVGCRIVAASGDVWFANGRFPRLSMSRFHCVPPGGATEFEAAFVTGCCMLVDAGMLRRGLSFDEAFFLYGEDADFCRQVQERGRTVWITQAATVEHHGEDTPSHDALRGPRLFWFTRAKVLLAKKHYRPLRRLGFYGNALVLAPIAALVRGHGLRWLSSYGRGLWAGLMAEIPAAARTQPTRALPRDLS